MRIAVVHAWGAGGDVSERVLDAVYRIWPAVDVYTTELHAAKPRATLPPTVHTFHPSAAGRHHVHMGCGTSVRCAGYDLVFSTSPLAARHIDLPDGTLHTSYLPPLPGHGAGLLPELPERIRSLWAFQRSGFATQSIHNDMDTGVGLPPRSVTHCIAASRVLRERYRDELGSSCPVIYPPIKTSIFRPSLEPRTGDYLLVCRGESLPDLGLAIEACRMMQRKLIVVDWSGPGVATLPPHAHVEFVDASGDAALRDYYRRCRGLLAPTISDFHSAILEAQACGTPVIALDCEGARETILDAESAGQGTGLFFHEPTISSLVSAIRELERRPQKFSPDLGMAQAARFSETHFDEEMRTLAKHLLARSITSAADDPETVRLPEPADRPQGGGHERGGEHERGKAAA